MTADVIRLSLLALLFTTTWLWLLWRLDRSDGVNWGGRWINRIDRLNRLFAYRYHRLVTEPMVLPEQGPAIVVCNHISGLDPLLLIAASPRPLRFIIATEEYHRFGLHRLFKAAKLIPVDRGGRPERAFRAALAALKAGEVVALFPQGRIYRDNETPRHLKAGAARLAEMTGATIYPFRLEGVAGEGTVFDALWKRSQARLIHYSPLCCDGVTDVACHKKLEQLMCKHQEHLGEK